MRGRLSLMSLLVLWPGLGAEALTISVSDASGDPGQRGVAVSISVDDAAGIAGGDFTLTYDPEVLTAVQVRAEELVTSAGIAIVSNLQTAGQVRVSMAGATGMASGRGALVTILFDVSAAALPGTYDLSLTRASLRNVQGELLTGGSIQSGTVSVIQAGFDGDELKADFDGDGQVGFLDFFAFADVFGQDVPPADARFDLDDDGTIGFLDFFRFADAFGSERAD